MARKTKTVYQKELINSICKKSGLSKMKSRKVLSAIKQSITESLSHGEPVVLKSFGTFSVKTQSSKRFFHIKYGDFVDSPAKNVVKFKKSKAWQLPMPKPKRKRTEKSATSLHKKSVPYALRRSLLDCDKELIEFYNGLVDGKVGLLPYVWKLNIDKTTYNALKGMLSWALDEYDDNDMDSNTLLKKHANLIAIYIGEWYKREYSNERGDEGNDALRSLGLSGSTQEYNLVWEYSSSAFDIERFLYQSKMTNRTKHSLYVLGGIPLQFEFKKLRAIIFNTLNKKSDETQEENETSEDEEFLVENIYLRESLIRGDGSLRLFINELRYGKYIEMLKNDEDYENFLQTYQDLQQEHFSKYKFRSEWIVYYHKGCGLVDRVLRIHLRNEYSNECDPMYISCDRLRKWNVPVDDIDDFDIVLKMNDGTTKKLFHFSYTNDNSFTCNNRTDYKTLESIPFDFEIGTFCLRSNETGEEYEIPEKPIVFNDVMRLFKTANEYEWTDSPHVNSTEATILCHNLYEPVEQEIAETLYLGEGENKKSFYWIPFENSITIRHKETGEETFYTSKVGRISIRLKQHKMGTLQNAVPMMEVEMRKSDGEYKKIPIFRKNPERCSKDLFIFEEYDQQRGVLKCKNLEREDDVSVVITQNGKELSYPIGLYSLSYGVFTIKCTKQAHSSTFTAFCIEDSVDIMRNLEEGTYVFSTGLSNALGGIWPFNPNIFGVKKNSFKENLSIDSGKDALLFCSVDSHIRIPVFRVAKKAYVAFIKGTPKVVQHNSNSRTPILYVPKSQQTDITRINVIDKDGVRGIDISEVTFRNTQLKEVMYTNSGYRLYIPDYNENKYHFIRYNPTFQLIKDITPTLIDRNLYLIRCREEDNIMQFIDDANKPDYFFKFISNGIHRDFGLKQLLELNESEKDCKMLPNFLVSYALCKDYKLTDNEYRFLIQLSDELRFDWMFLLPKVWKNILSQYPSLRNNIYNLFIFNKPDNDYVKAIANAILDGIDNQALWVNHRIDRNKECLGYKAVELLMPIHVQKSRKKTSVKHVNTKNADKVREVDMDPKNITVVREVSLTGCLRDEKFVDDFLDSLNEDGAYEEIYDYMKRYKLL